MFAFHAKRGVLFQLEWIGYRGFARCHSHHEDHGGDSIKTKLFYDSFVCQSWRPFQAWIGVFNMEDMEAGSGFWTFGFCVWRL